jgi:hypothetical protein
MMAKRTKAEDEVPRAKRQARLITDSAAFLTTDEITDEQWRQFDEEGCVRTWLNIIYNFKNTKFAAFCP